MGNPDLIFIFNNGLVVFRIKGVDYEHRQDALNKALLLWKGWMADAELEEIKILPISDFDLGDLS